MAKKRDLTPPFKQGDMLIHKSTGGVFIAVHDPHWVSHHEWPNFAFAMTLMASDGRQHSSTKTIIELQDHYALPKVPGK